MNIPLKSYWLLLVDYLRTQRWRVVLLAVLLSASIGLQLLNPQVLRYFIDQAVAGTAVSLLLQTAGLYMAVALLNQLFSAYSRYLGENVGWTATNLLRADLADHCLRLDLGFHKTRTPGEMIERIDGDVTALSNFFSQFIVGVLANAVLLVGVLILLWRVDWRVGLGLTTFAGAALTVMFYIRNLAAPHWAAVRQANAEFFGFLGERLAGTEDIRASGAVPYVMRRFQDITGRWLVFERRAGLASSAMWITNIIMFALGTGVAFALSASLYLGGTISIGTAYLIFNYTELIRRPMEQIRTQMQDLQKATASISRVKGLLALESRIRDPEKSDPEGGQVKDAGAQELPPGALAVDFSGLSFAYADDEGLVLEDVTLRLEAGKVLGLLGRTGSGKTTLARLLFRLYDPTAGDIRLGGVSLGEARLAAVRSRVGMVTQDVQLFHASVRDSLTFFDPSITDERILEVIYDLGLGSWLELMPRGLDTKLAAGGGGLSAGEAQLLAFARLFLANPGLVILDEASSRLDPATERLLEQAVTKVLTGRTGIIIAHRLATVHRADEICILEEGRVLEHGNRRRLAGDPASRFHHLLETGLEEHLV